MEELTGFYCPNCNKTWLEPPQDGVCPQCPYEPLHDLSTAEGRALAEQYEREERESGVGRLHNVGLWIGIVVGVLLLIPWWWLVYDPTRHLHGRGRMFFYLAPPLVLGPLVGHLVGRLYRHRTGLTPKGTRRS